MQITLSSGDYDIVSSGQTFLFGLDENLRINIASEDNFEFSVVLEFQENSHGEREIKKEVKDNVITLTCTNFNASGTGLKKPINIARVNGKEVFLMFWAYLEGVEDGKVRSVKYSVFVSDN